MDVKDLFLVCVHEAGHIVVGQQTGSVLLGVVFADGFSCETLFYTGPSREKIASACLLAAGACAEEVVFGTREGFHKGDFQKIQALGYCPEAIVSLVRDSFSWGDLYRVAGKLFSFLSSGRRFVLSSELMG